LICLIADNIRAIVPQIAMSAGTMIACSCREIVMGKHSSLGPVDPAFNGIPAIGVLEEIKKAHQRYFKRSPICPGLGADIVTPYAVLCATVLMGRGTLQSICDGDVAAKHA
jgi:hypothetical protein